MPDGGTPTEAAAIREMRAAAGAVHDPEAEDTALEAAIGIARKLGRLAELPRLFDAAAHKTADDDGWSRHVYEALKGRAWVPHHALWTVNPEAYDRPDDRSGLGKWGDYYAGLQAGGDIEWEGLHPEFYAYGLLRDSLDKADEETEFWDTTELPYKPKGHHYTSGSAILELVYRHAGVNVLPAWQGSGPIAREYAVKYAARAACHARVQIDPGDVDVYVTGLEDAQGAAAVPGAMMLGPAVTEVAVADGQKFQYIYTTATRPKFDMTICESYLKGNRRLVTMSFRTARGIIDCNAGPKRAIGDIRPERVAKYIKRGFNGLGSRPSPDGRDGATSDAGGAEARGAGAVNTRAYNLRVRQPDDAFIPLGDSDY